MQKVTSKGTLTNPVKLYSFLDAATASLSTDKGLNSVSKLADLAQDVRAVGLDQIEFMTIPNEPYPPDRNRLQWTVAGRRRVEGHPQRQAAARLRHRRPSPSPSATARSSLRPRTINVRVVNATGVTGAAKDGGQASSTALGYNVVGYTTGPAVRATTSSAGPTPRRRVGADPRRRRRRPSTRQVEGLGQVVELVIGTDYAGRRPPWSSAEAEPVTLDADLRDPQGRRGDLQVGLSLH